jgi:hypothetical protein
MFAEEFSAGSSQFSILSKSIEFDYRTRIEKWNFNST